MLPLSNVSKGLPNMRPHLPRRPAIGFSDVVAAHIKDSGIFATKPCSAFVLTAILAIGRQDIDPDGLVSPPGIKILAASSDHLVVDVSNYHGRMKVGTELPFQLDYSALLRAMTSPFIPKIMQKSQMKFRIEKV